MNAEWTAASSATKGALAAMFAYLRITTAILMGDALVIPMRNVDGVKYEL